MTRHLRRLAAIALVAVSSMVGVIAVAPAAQALSTGWVQANVPVDVGGGQDFTCTANFRMVAIAAGSPVSIESGVGQCIGGWDTSPGYCSMGEVGCTTFDWEIEGVGSCPDLHPIVSSHPSDNTVHRAFTVGAYQASAGDCDPLEVCAVIAYEGFGNDSTARGCVPLDLDPPTEDPSECEYGNMTGAWQESDELLVDNTSAAGTNRFYKGKHTVTMLASDLGGTWIPYILTSQGGSNVSPSVEWSPSAGALRYLGVIQAPSGSTLVVASLRITAHGDGTQQVAIARSGAGNTTSIAESTFTTTNRQIVGAGWVRAESWSSDVNAWRYPESSNFALNTLGVVGVHDPARCAFYFGTKVWDNATTTTDDPGGTIVLGEPEPPDDPEPPIDPPEDPPDDVGWLGLIYGVLRWIAGLLGDLGAAVGALPGAIANLMLAGLEALFIPDGDALSDTFAEINDSWDFEPIAEWTVIYENLWPASLSGCAGPTVGPIPTGSGSDIPASQPLNACSGTAADLAHWSTVFVYVGVTIMGLKSCMNSLLGGLGARILWNVGTDGRDKD